MNNRDIIFYRLAGQQVTGTRFTRAAELVQWMGCIQAQDFAGAKWAIGSRLGGMTEAAVEKEFNEGRFLRTHVLRPTWHFVSPADIRWMLRLTAPRIKALNKNFHRNLDITPAILRRSRSVLEKALAGGHCLDRSEISALLQKAKINTDDIRFSFLLMDAELDGVLCSGPRKGRQFTYALLEERVLPAAPLDRSESLAELARRYFISHGPATLPDFAWWSGLTLADAREGLEHCKGSLACEVIRGQAYWFSPDLPLLVPARAAKGVYLLPAFDEYAIGYKDRSDILPADAHVKTGNGIFKPIIIAGGKVAGTWQRTLAKNEVAVETEVFERMGKTADRAMQAAIKRYVGFLGKQRK